MADSSVYFRSGIDFQQAVLGLRAHRQEILAGNIANADTPTYKARDFDFQNALKEAIAGRESSALPLSMTSPAHLSGASENSGLPDLLYRVPAQMAADGNTVEMDHERNQFTENALRYNASVTFINGHLKSLLSAIQPQ